MRFFDYQKVKESERQAAQELLGTVEEPTELATRVSGNTELFIMSYQPKEPGMLTLLSLQIMGVRSRTFEVAMGSSAPTANGGASKLARIKLTDKERARLQEMIRKATSLEEIIRLEKELNEGRLPTGVMQAGDAMEE